MKKRTTLLFGLVATLIVSAAYTVIKTSGAHPGSTGAPGDLTCAQSGCHVNATVAQDTGLVNLLVYSEPDSTYTSGGEYTLTLQAIKPGISKFGFELVALKDSTDRNIGTFSLLEPVRTQVITHTAPGNDLRYSMTHKTAGTTTNVPGSIHWTMKWKAPVNNAGTITFWYATMCTNNNGQTTGDQIYLSHLQIRPKFPLDTSGSDTSTTSLRRHTAVNNQLRCFQEENSRILSVNYNGGLNEPATFLLYDLKGELLLEKSIQLVPGHMRERIELPVNCCDGAYLVKLQTRSGLLSNKIWLKR